VLEVVLGIDNIIFISILAAKLPVGQQQRGAASLGLALARPVMRILLLLSIAGWVIGLTAPLFTVIGHDLGARPHPPRRRPVPARQGDLRDPREARGRGGHTPGRTVGAASFGSVIVQIMLLDIVFSLDSVITAVGMVDELPVMIAAVVIAVGVMLVSAGRSATSWTGTRP
jgi:predicted tellurium resistance membrane protein TerC